MANKRYFNGCKADGDVMSRFYEMLSAVKVDEWGALVRQAKLAWDKCKDTRATKDGKLYTKANSVTADEMVMTNVTAMPMPNAVDGLFETPRNGQHP